MKIAMISQPMAGKSKAEILAAKEKAVADLEKRGYTVINTYFTDGWYRKQNAEETSVIQRGLFFLARSLEKMSHCHAVYFCEGWDKARGCIIEHDAAKAYKLELIYAEAANA